MIQDLENKKLYNENEKTPPKPEDKVFYFEGDRMLIKKDENGIPQLLQAAEFKTAKLQYLFRIEEERYFLVMEDKDNEHFIEGVSGMMARDLRSLDQKKLAFAAATAYHL